MCACMRLPAHARMCLRGVCVVGRGGGVCVRVRMPRACVGACMCTCSPVSVFLSRGCFAAGVQASLPRPMHTRVDRGGQEGHLPLLHGEGGPAQCVCRSTLGDPQPQLVTPSSKTLVPRSSPPLWLLFFSVIFSFWVRLTVRLHGCWCAPLFLLKVYGLLSLVFWSPLATFPSPLPSARSL
jgi:hypothetical protein